MKRARFLISSLLAAGFGTSHEPALAAFTKATTGTDDPNAGKLMRTFTQDHYVTLASHSSHASHASHSSGYGGGGHYSHTSHRSSTGGYGGDEPNYPPPTVYSPPTPTPTPLAQPLFTPENRASAPPPDGLPALSGRTKRFASIVRRVQIALIAQDLYSGAIDGVVGPGLRKALRKLQEARRLEVTGTITPATLDALMVSSQ